MKTSLFLVVVLSFSSLGFAADVYVPDNYNTIQDAITAVSVGDTVIVRPGTYFETISFLGKDIIVKSEKGAAVTVIDAGQQSSCVKFENGETLSAILNGFTLTNGIGSPDHMSILSGGGVFIWYSSPQVSNNIITGNEAQTSRGGGIYVYESSAAKILNNTICDNRSFDCGGGIYTRRCSPLIKFNEIYGNTAGEYGGGVNCSTYADPLIAGNRIMNNYSVQGGGGINAFHHCNPQILNNMIAWNSTSVLGGGISVLDAAEPVITNNTILSNTATHLGGGIACTDASIPTVTNSIIWNNHAPSGREIYIGDTLEPSVFTISYSDVDNGMTYVLVEAGCTLAWGAGMIDANPLFVDSTVFDLHLLHTSPCLNAGDNLAPSISYLDFEGDDRIADGTVDMGADEFFTHLYTNGDVLPGSTIRIMIIGEPGTTPVNLSIGSGVAPSPIHTPHGYIYLTLPVLNTWLLGDIPANGVYDKSVTVPPSWNLGEMYPFQALLGNWGDPGTVLTNLLKLEVE
jgi:parallel beta-helix repeat protein/predicted outer membrane repeat protein